MFWVARCPDHLENLSLPHTAGWTLWLVSGVIDRWMGLFPALVALHGGRRPARRLASAWGVLLMVRQMAGTQMRAILLAMSDELTRLQSPGVSRRAEAHGGRDAVPCC